MQKLSAILVAVALTAACGGGGGGPVRPPDEATPAGNAQINGAGATFPYPIYSKWFSEYNKLNPNMQINYQSIGSGGGIRQIIERDRVLRRHRRPDDRRDRSRQGSGTRFCTSRPCSAPSCPSTTSRASAAAEVHRAGARGHLSRQDHEVERSGDRARINPGVDAAGHRHHRRRTARTAPARRTSGSTILSKVSPEWKEQGRRRHVGQLAGRRRRQGQRRRRRARQADAQARSATSS